MPSILFAQKTSIIKGFIKDSQNNSIKNVSVNYGTIGVYSNNKGYYEIRVPVNEKVVIEFSHVGYKSLSKEFFINKKTIIRFSPTLQSQGELLDEVVIKNDKKDAQGITTINTEKIKRIPGANSGIEHF